MILRPFYHFDYYNKINKAKDKLEDERLMSNEVIEEVSTLTGYTVKNVVNVLEAYRKVRKVSSLIEAYHDRDDNDVKMPNKEVIAKEQRNDLQKEIQNLSFVERQIVTYRYGLDRKHGIMTLEELGKIFKISRERVRQIQKEAIGKLQKPKVRRMLESLIA